MQCYHTLCGVCMKAVLHCTYYSYLAAVAES